MYESGENYLETILMLEKEKGVVRSIDVVHHLNYSKPSVSRGVGLLKNEGYLIVDQQGYLKLTDKGRNMAEEIYEKHKILTMFLEKIAKVSTDVAEEDACRIEHIISQETYQGLKKYLETKL